MKNLIIKILTATICGCYLYLVGHNKGYDAAKESYTAFYEKIIEQYKSMYEEKIEELFDLIDEYYDIRKEIHQDQKSF